MAPGPVRQNYYWDRDWGQKELQMPLFFYFYKQCLLPFLSKLLNFIFNYIWSQLHSDPLL